MTDYYDEAMQAEYKPAPRTYYGQTRIETWPCVLKTGMGKIPFDPQQHKQGERRLSIDIEIIPLDDMAVSYQVARSLVAESREWTQFIKPNLVKLGTDLRAINGKWVAVRRMSTGKPWTSKKTGKTGEETTFEFLAIYDSEDACRQAYEASKEVEATDTQPASAATNTPPWEAAAAVQSTQSNPERDTAAKFLPALWAQSGKDLTKFAELIAKMPLTSKYFTVSSPEVLSIISQAA